MPASAHAADGSIQQQAENEVLDEVRRLANYVVDEIDLYSGQRWNQPVDDRLEKPRRMIGRESIRG